MKYRRLRVLLHGLWFGLVAAPACGDDVAFGGANEPGEDGAPGKDGQPGNDGNDGNDGDDGQDGQDLSQWPGTP
jgi:hypothetical protein